MDVLVSERSWQGGQHSIFRWQEGPSLVEARSGHTSFVTSQVGRWSCARFKLCSCTHSHCAPAQLMLYQCGSASCIEQLLPTPGLDTSYFSYLHYIHQGILLVGGGDSPSTAELVRYNQAMRIEYYKIRLWSKKLERSTYYTLKALLIKRDQCQPWWYIVNLDAKNDCGQWPSQFPLCLLCFHL